LSNEKYSISWASPDCRVVRLRQENEMNNPVLIANVVNNFPKSWNRQEANKGHLEYRFSVTGQNGPFDAGFSSRFGWENSTPVLLSRSLYRIENSEKSFFNISDKNIIILNLQAVSETGEVIFYFQNLDGKNSSQAKFSSDYFHMSNGRHINFLGDSAEAVAIKNNMIDIKLQPNEIGCIRLEMKLR